MSDHLKRLRAPDSWHIAKKTNTFVTKTVPGPHNANAMPVAVWLRDHMGFVRNQKEVKTGPCPERHHHQRPYLPGSKDGNRYF